MGCGIYRGGDWESGEGKLGKGRRAERNEE